MGKKVLEKITEGVPCKICFGKKFCKQARKNVYLSLPDLKMLYIGVYLYLYNKYYHYLFLVTVVFPTFLDTSDNIKPAASHLAFVGRGSRAGSLNHRDNYSQTSILHSLNAEFANL